VNPDESPVSVRIRGIADALTLARVETVLRVLADFRCE
jgi:hypothetical protein